MARKKKSPADAFVDWPLDGPGCDGVNVGVNIGVAAGQSGRHGRVHGSPFEGDHPSPRGGVRAVLPDKSYYPHDARKAP
jgi:diadenosine tetraphosphate (Ap4A) HIT family hydrolase